MIATFQKKRNTDRIAGVQIMHPCRKELMRKKCGSCIYRTMINSEPFCQYILITGKQRGCEFGNKCQKYKRGKQAPTLDAIKTRQMEKKDIVKNLKKNNKPVNKKKISKWAIIVDDGDGNRYKFESRSEFAAFLGLGKKAVQKAMQRSGKKEGEVYGYKWKLASECKEYAEGGKTGSGEGSVQEDHDENA